jgi:orotate phosphoribosyltransferase
MDNRNIASALLDIQAVRFTPHDPITFRSGILSPVYVDNRLLIHWPEQWRSVIHGLRDQIKARTIEFDIIAGIATGGIPHSSALAYELRMPSVFVRKESKGYGAQKMIEGGTVEGKRVLLIEDMVTTAGSSLKGVAALREEGAIVADCLCITTFGFTVANQAFEAAEVNLCPLVEFATIVDEGLRKGIFGDQEYEIIQAWMNDPQNWTDQHNERN